MPSALTLFSTTASFFSMCGWPTALFLTGKTELVVSVIGRNPDDVGMALVVYEGGFLSALKVLAWSHS